MAGIPSLTKIYHTEPYAAIDPTQPALSAKGKVVVITGGGSGIGKAIARAFSRAEAAHIVIIGRKEKPLNDTKSEVENATKSKAHVFVADITDKRDIDNVFRIVKSSIGPVDILVNNAGYLPGPENIANASVDDWWRGFEVNVKGAFLVMQAFLSVAADNAIILNISTTGVHFIAGGVGLSSYAASKTALVRVLNFVQEENPGLTVINLHPGFMKTEMNLKSGIKGIPFDDINLSANSAVWCASPEATFLKGRFVWANWDVEELKSREVEILRENKLMMGLSGWP